MTMLKRMLVLVALLSGSAFAQQDFSKVEIKTTKLADTIYMMEGAGGNLGVSVGDDAVFVIDDEFAPLSERITAAIAALSPKPVKFILNTHWHGDHAGGNESFAKQGAIIVAHENVRKRMGSEQFIEFMRSNVPASPRAALPVVTFAQTVSFHLNGDELRAVHMPRAHTDGDAIVIFGKSDVIHAGDTFFNGMYPFIDTSSGGTVDGMVAACDYVLGIATERTKIIPGHGPLGDRASLKSFRDMLATVSTRVKKMLAEGKKLEEITASGVSSDFDPQWGKGFIKPDKFVEMVAMNLQKGR
jgi:glyoxylase-like metal-dependent hydrolase (beta-lactamase superfamily II)